MTNNKSIKNIIFDLGSVLLNIDFEPCVKAFEKMGIYNVYEKYYEVSEHNLFMNFERGTLSEEDFYTEVQKIATTKISNKEIEAAWNEIIRDFRDEAIEMLIKLSKNHRIFLLSNSNIIHYKYYHQNFKNKYGYEFTSLFEKDWYSHELGIVKPDTNIYKKVLKEASLLPEETIFIDDNENNIIGAKKCGLNTIHLVLGDVISNSNILIDLLKK